MTFRHIDRAFLLAAGLGTRLRPFTDTLPKPMVPVWGLPLIDHALNRLQDAKTGQVRVNLHHFGEVLEKHLSPRTCPKITFSWEKNLLDAGGGIKAALPFFGADPFYILNGDSLWIDGLNDPTLTRLAQFWNDETMDLLILLHPIEKMRLTRAGQDYDLDERDGRPKRSLNKSGRYAFTGLRIAHPRLFADTPDGPFPFLPLMDRAEQNGRLFALVHDGDWHHISTPEDLANVEASPPPKTLEPGHFRVKEGSNDQS